MQETKLKKKFEVKNRPVTFWPLKFISKLGSNALGAANGPRDASEQIGAKLINK